MRVLSTAAVLGSMASPALYACARNVAEIVGRGCSAAALSNSRARFSRMRGRRPPAQPAATHDGSKSRCGTRVQYLSRGRPGSEKLDQTRTPLPCQFPAVSRAAPTDAGDALEVVT
jgi:hypothetical protein